MKSPSLVQAVVRPDGDAPQTVNFTMHKVVWVEHYK